MSTAVVDITSDLIRKKWMREGLIQRASKSFWSAFTGKSKDSVVFQSNNENADAGHTVVFDYDGNLSGKAIKGKDTAYGKGEQKKKFSNKLTVERFRLVVDNGDKFDGKAIGDLGITEHGDSRSKLADLFVRFKDQALFDAAQGFKPDSFGIAAAPTHTIQIDASVTPLAYTDLVSIEKILMTGQGYKTGTFGSSTAASNRAPLTPYRLADGRSVWLCVLDPFTCANLKSNTSSSGLLQLMQHADLRGDGNRVISGVLGRIGRLVFVEAEAFFGESTGTGLNESEIEIAGLRQYDSANTAWSGEAAFANPIYSRNLILGAGALQLGMGKQPDYKWQPSQDFAIKSESALEVWMETQKTKLTPENGDYKQAKRGNLDHGVIALDVKIA